MVCDPDEAPYTPNYEYPKKLTTTKSDLEPHQHQRASALFFCAPSRLPPFF